MANMVSKHRQDTLRGMIYKLMEKIDNKESLKRRMLHFCGSWSRFGDVIPSCFL